jgi:hypothetical protein
MGSEVVCSHCQVTAMEDVMVTKADPRVSRSAYCAELRCRGRVPSRIKAGVQGIPGSARRRPARNRPATGPRLRLPRK